jgi:hypothetical protein
MKNSILIVAMTALLLGGCASTPSKPLSFNQLGNFSTTPLNQQSYRISFNARPNMSFATAEEITLVKAAQTTLQQGFQFFQVLNDPSNRSQHPPRQALVYPSPMYYPYGYRRGYWHDPFYDLPRMVNVEPTQIAYSIECFTEKNAPEQAFDARLIMQSLGAKYGLSVTGEDLPQTPTPP